MLCIVCKMECIDKAWTKNCLFLCDNKSNFFEYLHDYIYFILSFIMHLYFSITVLSDLFFPIKVYAFAFVLKNLFY